MWKKVKDFLASLRAVVVWSVGYVLISYWVFRFLFAFDILSTNSWASLLSVHLRGLWGLAFGVLLVAVPAVYVATTVVVWHNKKALIDNPFKKKTKKDNKKVVDKPQKKEEERIIPPSEMPEELHGAYIHMRRGSLMQGAISTPCVPSSGVNPPSPPEEPTDNAPSLMPLPDDFSFNEPDPVGIGAPQFKTISFGTPAPAPLVMDTSMSAAPDETSESESVQKMRMHLSSLGQTHTVRDGVIISRGGDETGPILCIAVHADADFWVADGDTWFATGKQKPSPVAAILAAQKESDNPNTAGILYLAERNIMNLDTLEKQWRMAGIRIISAPTDL